MASTTGLANTATAPAHETSLLRLYLLRGTYLLIALGLGPQIWPLIFHHRAWTDLMHGVAVCLLAAVTALALLGVRYPLRMLPLLFLELVWKSLWLLAMALPMWRAGALDADALDTVQACLMGIIFPIVIPWGYVWRHYVVAPGDRWR
jgi:hypothetical protein